MELKRVVRTDGGRMNEEEPLGDGRMVLAGTSGMVVTTGTMGHGEMTM